MGSCLFVCFADPDSKQLEFNCVSLHHPTAVCGFEWRRTGRYMPRFVVVFFVYLLCLLNIAVLLLLLFPISTYSRKCIQAALMTWCADNTSRIWKETPAPELSIIDISGDGGLLLFLFTLIQCCLLYHTIILQENQHGNKLDHANCSARKSM